MIATVQLQICLSADSQRKINTTATVKSVHGGKKCGDRAQEIFGGSNEKQDRTWGVGEFLFSSLVGFALILAR